MFLLKALNNNMYYWLGWQVRNCLPMLPRITWARKSESDASVLDSWPLCFSPSISHMLYIGRSHLPTDQPSSIKSISRAYLLNQNRSKKKFSTNYYYADNIQFKWKMTRPSDWSLIKHIFRWNFTLGHLLDS